MNDATAGLLSEMPFAEMLGVELLEASGELVREHDSSGNRHAAPPEASSTAAR